MPFYPILLVIALWLVAPHVHTTLGLYAKPILSAQCGDACRLSLQMLAILLTLFGGTLLLTFRDGLIEPAHHDEILGHVATFVEGLRGQAESQGKVPALTAFHDICKAELKIVFTGLWNIGRFFKWTNYTAFLAIAIAALLSFYMNASGIHAVYRWILRIIEVTGALLMLQIVTCGYPYMVRALLLVGAGHKKPEAKWQKFLGDFAEAKQQTTTLADLIAATLHSRGGSK